MKIEEKIASIFIAGVLLYALIPKMFELSLITGLGFVIACSLALYKGVIFKKPEIIVLIFLGYTLTNAATSRILPQVYENFIQNSLLEAAIISTVFLMLYLKGKELQSY
jgi:hypothetical protein